MRIPFAQSPRFAALATIGFGLGAVIDGLAIGFSIARGQLDFGVVRHALFLLIFGSLAFVCVRRLRNTPTDTAAADDDVRKMTP